MSCYRTTGRRLSLARCDGRTLTIVLRSGNAKIAGELSALVQGGGYTLAAMGPLILGLMIDAQISIQGITWLLLTILAFAVSMALLAGRQLRLEMDAQGALITVKQQSNGQ